MNWGKSIVLCFILFASFVGIMAYQMATAKVDLVQADYYQKGIDFQKEIKRNQNSLNFNKKNTMTYFQESKELKINFPTTVKSGEVIFYRPSDKNMDFKLPIKNSKNFEYSTKNMQLGNWKIRAYWTDGALEYTLSDEFFIK